MMQYDPRIAPLSWQNSFKFGYNGSWFNSRESGSDTWMTTYDPVSRPVLDFRSECINTAKLVRDSTDLPLDVLLSGGQDSEVVVAAFKAAGIPINVIIMRFADGYNAYDIAYATKYCESHGITPRFIDLDIMEFMSGEAWKYAEQTSCINPPMLPHLWLIDQCDNYVVIGSGDVFLDKNVRVKPGEVPDVEYHMIHHGNHEGHVYTGQWLYREHESIASLQRHFMKDNRPGCPGFFQFNPEIVLSWLNEPEVLRDTALESRRVTTHYTKYDIYRRAWNTQPRPKFDGFEIVRHAMSVPKMRKELERLYPDHMQTWRIPMEDLVSILEGK